MTEPRGGDPKRELKVFLAEPRGFCAGVTRAIDIVERALEKYGAPVYVRHEIVHNAHVVDRLRGLGAVFVDEVDEAPADRPIVFSAHGVPKRVPQEATRRGMTYVDATCPLVSKVHNEARRQNAAGRHVLAVGHAGHPEIEGTLGQLPRDAATLIETVEDAERFTPPQGQGLAYVTQTTLSVDDTADIIRTLQTRFPDIRGPRTDDICYATTNRQNAVKAIAPRVDAMIVVGAENSSNSQRLVETAKKAGCQRAMLACDAGDIDWSLFETARAVGVTAGASSPERLVEDVLQALKERFEVFVETVATAEETVAFRTPRALAS